MMNRPRTLLDEIGQILPNLDAARMRVLAIVSDVPGICMSEVAETLDMDLSTVHFHTRTLGDGYLNRESFGLLKITKCSADKRKRLLKLTHLGIQVAKIIQPLNVAINDEMKLKKDESQLDLLNLK
ncbi:MAG: hypothetical protein RPT25_06565 [Cycloclasticus sp.]|jgi:hypothetical protein